MSYVINTIEDLERILRENPEWRERIRILILEEELRRLPARFERFVEEEFRPLRADVEVLKEDMKVVKGDVEVLKSDVEVLKSDVEVLKSDVEVLKSDVEVLKSDVGILKKDVGVLKVDVAKLRGESFERKVRENAPAFLGRVIRRLRPIDKFTLADILDDAIDSGLIEEDMKDFALKVDFAGKGRLKETGKEVHIALEATLTLYPEDVEKVFKRAMIISKAVGQETIPVVVYLNAKEEALSLAEEMGVLAVKTVAEEA
ncbi:hypothetical protein [Pampinifervens florentissimum]|uniref:hypothetical protein n=1 Tax=Pampinifervens florentissimum TaxID=1632019 RepID=UPI0013B493AB|nr:hypothetical protein [Hydrogenobacter sp. T-8]QID32678.1 hypothetical protein G3M65_02350 [Hydrogenobacter sp. T-8]